MSVLTIAYTGEGATDERFLGGVIKRTFEEVALTCRKEIEIYDPDFFHFQGNSFVEGVVNVAREAKHWLVLCVHTDADDADDQRIRETKINPAWATVWNEGDNCCQNLVAIVPIRATEAWMLADWDTLTGMIGWERAERPSDPERIGNPKGFIEELIRQSLEGRTRRQRGRQLSIGDLYQPLGNTVDLALLGRLTTWQRFRAEVENAFRVLNYLV